MARGKELDGLIQVRRPVPVLESGLKAVGKVVERDESIRCDETPAAGIGF